MPFSSYSPPAEVPRRIALVTEYYYPHLGGICEHVHFFAQEARRRGHHVDIITSHIPGAPTDPHVIRIGRSVPVYANGSVARFTVGRGLRRQLRDTLRRGQYDVVHVHTPLVPTLPMLAIEVSNVPVVGTIHTYLDRSLTYELFPRVFQRLLDRLDAVICVSPTAAAAHERWFDFDYTIIPNGVDLDVFRPDVPRPSVIRPDVPTILFLQRFEPRNGFPTLLEAFRKVRGRGRPAQLVVVGDGPLRRHYQRMAGGDRDIAFVGGLRQERPMYYAHSDIYACPTTKASFGITLLEAMACATPIICSDIAGFGDVVEHEREALMTPCGDADALGDGLVRLLEDDVLRARLGWTGRHHVARYAWPHVTDEVLALYDRVLGASTVAA